jgi:hypothetical protein
MIPGHVEGLFSGGGLNFVYVGRGISYNGGGKEMVWRMRRCCC